MFHYRPPIEGTSFHEVYHQVLREVYESPEAKLYNLVFYVAVPTRRRVLNPVLNFRPAHAEHFYQWIRSGSKELNGWMADHMAHTASFIEEVSGRCTAYGPRIMTQVGEVIAELTANPPSRRACILILEREDQAILMPKRNDFTGAEYPCTVSLHYRLYSSVAEGRTEDRLHATTVMRSQNVYNVLPYDFYNFSRLQEDLARNLGVLPGSYSHFCLDAHIPDPLVDKAKEALDAEPPV